MWCFVVFLLFVPSLLFADPLGDSVEELVNRLPGSVKMTKPFLGYVYAERDGEVLVSKGFGNEISGDSKFAIGSVTKSVVAAEISRLAQEGALSLSDPISKYIKQLPEWAKTVTIEQLANHTSGFANYTSVPEFKKLKHRALGLSDILALTLPKSPTFEVGSRWAYSNTNYYLLGVIIEKTTGKPYIEQLQRGVLERAELGSVGSYKETNTIQGYAYKNDDVIAIPLPHHSGPSAAGELAMTPVELATWGRHLASSTAFVDRLSQTSPHRSYGLGLFVESDGWRSHGGGIDGFQSYFAFNVKTKDVVVVLGSCIGCGVPEIGTWLKASIAGLAPAIPDAVSDVTKQEANHWLGRFVLSEASKKTAVQVAPGLEKVLETLEFSYDRTLMAKPAGQPKFAVKQLDGSLVGPSGITFHGSEVDNGAFTEVTLKQGGLKLIYKRVPN